MKNETIAILRHILTARIDNAKNTDEYLLWCEARDIVEYALADNVEVLKLHDYLNTKED